MTVWAWKTGVSVWAAAGSVIPVPGILSLTRPGCAPRDHDNEQPCSMPRYFLEDHTRKGFSVMRWKSLPILGQPDGGNLTDEEEGIMPHTAQTNYQSSIW